MKEKLAVIVDNKEEITTGDCDGKMYTSACDVAMEMCTPECHDTRGDGCSTG